MKGKVIPSLVWLKFFEDLEIYWWYEECKISRELSVGVAMGYFKNLTRARLEKIILNYADFSRVQKYIKKYIEKYKNPKCLKSGAF